MLNYVHSDLWGASKDPTLGGGRYFLSIIDDFCRKVWVYILKTKVAAFQKLKDWKTLVEVQIVKKKRQKIKN